MRIHAHASFCVEQTVRLIYDWCLVSLVEPVCFQWNPIMNARKSVGLCIALLVSLGGPIANAQKPEFETSYNERFLNRNNLIGKKPDIELFDAQGRPFSFASAEGKYTVVVFGCLT